jgi:Flp pilus assembly protein TadB
MAVLIARLIFTFVRLAAQSLTYATSIVLGMHKTPQFPRRLSSYKHWSNVKNYQSNGLMLISNFVLAGHTLF